MKSLLLWLLAWVVSAALWMLLADSVRLVELLTGAGVAVVAATAFEVVRRQRMTEQAVRPDLSLRVWRVVLKVVPDVVRLTRAAFMQLVERKPARGRIVGIPFGYVPDDPDDGARRAVAVGLGSVAPNTIVIGVDPESGLLLVHQLEPTRNPNDLDPMRLR